MVRLVNFIKSNPSCGYQIGSVVARSGVTISQLKVLVKQNRQSLQANSVTLLFVATNDIKLGRSYTQIVTDFLALLKLLRRLGHPTSVLVITKLPFFPKYKSNHCVLHKIDAVNKFIASLSNASVRFINWEFPLSLEVYFHDRYATSQRIDRLHLNNRGFSFLLRQLSEVFSLYCSGLFSPGR